MIKPEDYQRCGEILTSMPDMFTEKARLSCAKSLLEDRGYTALGWQDKDGNGRVEGFITFKGPEIKWLAVEPVMWGRGIGQYLVRTALESISNNHHYAVVLVPYDRDSSVTFYKINGFDEVRKLEMKDWDALLMAREL